MAPKKAVFEAKLGRVLDVKRRLSKPHLIELAHLTSTILDLQSSLAEVQSSLAQAELRINALETRLALTPGTQVH